MKNRLFHICIALATLLIAYSCKEDLGVSKPLFDDKQAPGDVQVISVENIAGGAIIKYHTPKDPDLHYIKASYEIRPGVFREKKISKLSDTIAVSGFMEEKEYDVKLTAYDIGENASDGIVVKINPETAPITTFAQTLNFGNDFGGMSIITNNPTRSEFLIKIYEDDGKDNFVTPLNVFYTEAEEVQYNVRGYKGDSLVNFLVSVEDAYGNEFGPIKTSIMPWHEIALDRSLYRALVLPSDIPVNTSYPMSHAWDGNLGTFYHTEENPDGMPAWFTIDLGKKSQLSRFRYYQRDGFLWRHNNFKRYEIYGSNTPVDNWDAWILLGEFESHKPSGLPAGQNTSEDDAYARAGEDYNFPAGNESYRYLRFKVLENWGRTEILQASEIMFWGQYAE